MPWCSVTDVSCVLRRRGSVALAMTVSGSLVQVNGLFALGRDGPRCDRRSCRASGGTGEQDMSAVVGGIAVAAAGALDVLDRGVRGLGAGVGDAGDEQHLDRVPPGVDGGPEPVA